MAFFVMTFETSSVYIHIVGSWARPSTNSTILSWNEDVHVLHVPRWRCFSTTYNILFIIINILSKIMMFALSNLFKLEFGLGNIDK